VAEVRAALDSGDFNAAAQAIVGSALHGDGDWRELQELYLELLDHPEQNIRRLGALCLGHLARVHLQLDERRVVPILRRLRRDPEIGGTAEDALGDIADFLHPRRGLWRNRLYQLTHPQHWR
jgi:hypothetical protein